MKSSTKHRIAAAALAGLGISLAGVAAISPTLEPSLAIAQPDRSAFTPPETSLSVIQLKYINVHEFRVAAESAALDHYSQMTVDGRSNSIILNASPASTQKIKELVKILDVQIDEDEGDDEIKVFSLKYAAANGALISSLSEVLYSPNRNVPSVRMSMDQSSNQLIARGKRSSLAQLDALLQQLDKPMQQPTAASDINVRLLWLTSEASGKVPADAKDVTDALADMGVTGLGLAAQTIIRATNRSNFGSEFVTGSDDRWHIQFAGTAHTDDTGNWTMEISVNGRQAPSDGLHIPASLEFDTRLTTQTGHFVVLGVSPIGDTESVFVLQVVEAD